MRTIVVHHARNAGKTVDARDPALVRRRASRMDPPPSEAQIRKFLETDRWETAELSAAWKRAEAPTGKHSPRLGEPLSKVGGPPLSQDSKSETAFQLALEATGGQKPKGKAWLKQELEKAGIKEGSREWERAMETYRREMQATDAKYQVVIHKNGSAQRNSVVIEAATSLDAEKEAERLNPGCCTGIQTSQWDGESDTIAVRCVPPNGVTTKQELQAKLHYTVIDSKEDFRKSVNEFFSSRKIVGKHGKADIREQPSPAGGKEYFADFPDGKVEGPFMSIAQLKARVKDAVTEVVRYQGYRLASLSDGTWSISQSDRTFHPSQPTLEAAKKKVDEMTGTTDASFKPMSVQQWKDLIKHNHPDVTYRSVSRTIIAEEKGEEVGRYRLNDVEGIMHDHCGCHEAHEDDDPTKPLRDTRLPLSAEERRRLIQKMEDRVRNYFSRHPEEGGDIPAAVSYWRSLPDDQLLAEYRNTGKYSDNKGVGSAPTEEAARKRLAEATRGARVIKENVYQAPAGHWVYEWETETFEAHNNRTRGFDAKTPIEYRGFTIKLVPGTESKYTVQKKDGGGFSVYHYSVQEAKDDIDAHLKLESRRNYDAAPHTGMVMTATVNGKRIKVRVLEVDHDANARVWVVEVDNPDKDHMVLRRDLTSDAAPRWSVTAVGTDSTENRWKKGETRTLEVNATNTEEARAAAERSWTRAEFHSTKYKITRVRSIDAKNHLGEREYQTYTAWRAAARTAGAVRFEGDKDIAHAINAEGKHVGEWGGDVGSIYLTKDQQPYAPGDRVRVKPGNLGEGAVGKVIRVYEEHGRTFVEYQTKHGKQTSEAKELTRDAGYGTNTPRPQLEAALAEAKRKLANAKREKLSPGGAGRQEEYEELIAHLEGLLSRTKDSVRVGRRVIHFDAPPRRAPEGGWPSDEQVKKAIADFQRGDVGAKTLLRRWLNLRVTTTEEQNRSDWIREALEQA